MSLLASLPCLDARAFRAASELARAQVFDERVAREEDQRALALEREELHQFLREYEEWLDDVRDEPPSYPTPETIHNPDSPCA